MCLAVPVKVEQLLENAQALVELGGIKTKISLALVEDVQVGDYVILHVGFALSKLNTEEAEQTFEAMGIEAEPKKEKETEKGKETGSPSDSEAEQ
jgi:hydrogenase expression/formation protein HypC